MDKKLLDLHRSRKDKHIQLAKELAAELNEIFTKYNKLKNAYYGFTIDAEPLSVTTKGIRFNEFNVLSLLDLYYPENQDPVVNLSQ